ncbi:hypothetical protein A6E15_04375 [Natrinema saccharevitans]|uniref:PhiH1 repressor n=1 Tax=Natrinema saccharevitans TaxID=301967 RepID=A0A1S8AU87_9EURY|nr:hypothetical protein [Natrinema saccharevitans]OLZ40265.1 hypothetical protein A6E15_04375 [Natrinema saccharevitans]
MDDATPDDANVDGSDEAEPDEPETDAEWMDPADERILEYMQAEDVFEPNQFDEAGICPADFAAYRCRELTKYGLMTRYMPGVYEVSDAGERYLAGDLDPSELEPDE